MNLTNNTISTLYEGVDTSQYEILSGATFNRPLSQLISNDLSLKVSADSTSSSLTTIRDKLKLLTDRLDAFTLAKKTLLEGLETRGSSATGLTNTTSSRITQLGSDVNAAKTTLGSSSSGLIKDVEDLNTLISAFAGTITSLRIRLESIENHIIRNRASYLQSLIDNTTLAPPLNVNGFLIGGYEIGPAGYGSIGTCEVYITSAYAKGFQGSYHGSRPSNASSSQDSSTSSRPFYYGAYQTGPRTLWGGLSGGHHTPLRYYKTSDSSWSNSPSNEGCLLKLYKPSGTASDTANACLFTMKHFCNTRKVRFRAYVWINEGSKNFKVAPVNPDDGGTISVQNLKEWTPVDVVIDTKGSTGKYWSIFLQDSSAQTIYIGMLSIYPVEGSGNDRSAINIE